MRSIGEIITGRKLFTISGEASILDAVNLMVKRKIGALPVVNLDNRIVGIFTERDLLKRVVAAQLDIKTTKVAEVMTGKLVTASTEATPISCLKKMKEKNFRHLLVTRERNIVGIVSQRDLIEIDLEKKNRALQAIDA